MCLLVFPVSFQNLQALIDEVSGQLDLIELLTNQSYCRRPIFLVQLAAGLQQLHLLRLGLAIGHRVEATANTNRASTRRNP